MQNLQTVLTADSAQFDRAMHSASGSVRKFEAAASRAGGGAIKGFQGALGGVQGVAASAGSGISSALGGIGSMAMTLGPAALAILGVGGAVAAVTKAVSLAATAEQAEAAFATMLGGADKAKEMLSSIQQFAAVTPFESTNLRQSAQMLMNFGVTGEQVMPVLKMLGDVAGGDAQRLEGLSRAFGQITSTGRLMGQDLNQLINAGFNPLQEMSRTTGIEMSALKDRMEKGGISVRDVANAFQTVTGEGGRFHGMMENQSKTLTGLFSTMKDSVTIGLMGMGQAITDAFDLKAILTASIKSIDAIVAGIGKGFRAIAAVVGPPLGQFLDFVVEKFQAVVAIGGQLIDRFAPPILAAFTALVEYAVPIFTQVYDAVSSAFTAIVDFTLPIVIAYVGAVTAAWSAIYGAAMTIFNAVSEVVTGAWELIGGQTTSFMGGFKEVLIAGFIAIEFAFTHVGQIAEYVWVSMLAGAATFANSIAHFFTSTIPTAVDYMGTAFSNVGNYILTVMSNLGQNISQAVGEIWDYLTSMGDDPIEFNFKSLTEGLEVGMQKLPEFAERQMGTIEQALHEQAGDLGRGLSTGFDEFAAKRSQEIAEQEAAIKDAFSFTPSEAAAGETAAAPGIGGVDLGAFSESSKAPKGGAKNKPTELKALEFGSAEAFSAINRSRFGVEHPELDTAKNTKEAAETLKVIEKNTARPPIQLSPSGIA